MTGPQLRPISGLTTASGINPDDLLAMTQGGESVNIEVLDLLAIHGYLWWSATIGQVVANNVWTPIDWTHPYTDLDNLHQGLTGATTIAAGSNGAALPQGTIHVASTTDFITPSATNPGWITVTLADGKNRVINYTGKTATSFTGCSLGAGSLATGQTVAQSNCIVSSSNRFQLQIFECAFADNGTGGRAVRGQDLGAPWFFVGAQVGPIPAIAGETMHLQFCMQAVGNVDGSGGGTMQVKQTSGGPLEVVSEGISSPSLMCAFLGPNRHSV